MTRINGFGLQPNINAPKVKPNAPEQEAVKQETGAKPQTKHQSADDVLNFMSQNTMADVAKSEVKSSRTIQVSKYVTPDQAKRIAGFIQEFSSTVEKGMKQIEKEFPNLPEYQNMSEQAKLNLAVDAFAKTNL